MDIPEFDGEDTRAFYYGLPEDEVNFLFDPFEQVAVLEELLGYPLAHHGDITDVDRN